MRAGPLDRKLVILKAGPVENEYGDEVDGYTPLPPLAASRRPATGSERLSSAENAASAPVIFKIRWKASLDPNRSGGLNPKDKIEFPPESGRIYDITSATEIGRCEGIEIAATARPDR